MFLGPILAALVLLASGVALVRLRAELLYSYSRGLLPKEGAFVSPSYDTSRSYEDVRTERALEASSKAVLAASGSHLELARWHRRHAISDSYITKRIEKLCNAESALEQELSVRPFASGALLNWASIRQMLGRTVCPGTIGGNADFENALQFAVRQDPTNPRILYGGALLEIWQGRKRAALPLLHKVLQYDLSLSRGQNQLIMSLVETEQDLRELVPARFPQITNVSALIMGNNPQLFRALKSSFASLQETALHTSVEEYRAGAIDSKLYLGRLLALLRVVASSALRQKVDEALSSYLGSHGQRPLAEYLQARASLKNLAIVRAVTSADTRPSKSALTNWENRDLVDFDQFYRSVGFYLGEGQLPQRIELVSGKSGAAPSLGSIRVFVSNDNQDWIEAEPCLKKTFQFEGRPIVVMEPDVGYYKFWKIHFSSAARDQQFVNLLPELLQVYGKSRRAE